VDRDRSGYITANEVEDLLFETYGFPPLEEEVKSKLSDIFILNLMRPSLIMQMITTKSFFAFCFDL
jgi:hypothetical protein